MIELRRYTKDQKDCWDSFLSAARNATLLHKRDYMDYHADRFCDTSLVFTDKNNKIKGLFPACVSRKHEATICSHEGLTYGGLVLPMHTHSAEVGEMLKLAMDYYRDEMGAKQVLVKPIPHIYDARPAEDELFFLHSFGGELIERHLSQAIRIGAANEMSELRRRCIARAQREGVVVKEIVEERDWWRFHELLCGVLEARHGVKPVHSAAELWSLHLALPSEIRLFAAYKDSRMLAGTVVYLSPVVAHTQYLAASEEGRSLGALDLVVSKILCDPLVCERDYLDFGVSTERDGSLNAGLAAQKEGFGAAGICYDTYCIQL